MWLLAAQECGRSVANLEALTIGKFPKELEKMFTQQEVGLFPSPREVSFQCSCPKGASMCKHVAAALYGVGARFDEDPTLFFTLRDIPFEDLLKKSIEEKMGNMLQNAGVKTKRVIDEADIGDLFGL